MAELRDQIRQLTADRHSPEAKALYATVARYVDRRVCSVVRHAASDLLSPSESEEIVADVLLQLVTGALAQFRGNSIGELMAFVRTVTDRRLWRVIKRKVREKRMMEAVRPDAQDRLRDFGTRPDHLVRIVPDLPLPEADEAYLRALLEAGSKAELARQLSLSRAAVTQRVQRIRRRIDALQPQQQLAVDAWLEQAAREAIQGHILDPG
jgi:DNA-directed RNA polymerase specialized sigma24 family protein